MNFLSFSLSIGCNLIGGLCLCCLVVLVCTCLIVWCASECECVTTCNSACVSCSRSQARKKEEGHELNVCFVSTHYLGSELLCIYSYYAIQFLLRFYVCTCLYLVLSYHIQLFPQLLVLFNTLLFLCDSVPLKFDVFLYESRRFNLYHP